MAGVVLLHPRTKTWGLLPGAKVQPQETTRPVRQVPEQAAWMQYEQEKAAWKRANPTAPPEVYDRAVAEIAERLGL